MNSVTQCLLCIAGMHQYQFIGNDGADRIYRCKCGQRKVERYSLKVNHIGWDRKQARRRWLRALLPGRGIRH